MKPGDCGGLTERPGRQAASLRVICSHPAAASGTSCSTAEGRAAMLNVIVLQDTDDDNNPATPFGAGNAATVIAGRVATDGPGFSSITTAR